MVIVGYGEGHMRFLHLCIVTGVYLLCVFCVSLEESFLEGKRKEMLSEILEDERAFIKKTRNGSKRGDCSLLEAKQYFTLGIIQLDLTMLFSFMHACFLYLNLFLVYFGVSSITFEETAPTATHGPTQLALTIRAVAPITSNGGNIFWVLSDCRHYFRLYCVNAWLKLNASCHVSHIFILSLAILFFWSHTTTFINKSPPRIPEVHILGDPFPWAVNALMIEINRSFSVLREIASGRDLKKSLIIIASPWVLSMDERF
ncbi:hypothetical protein AAG906_024287 [Vitis piasezkii]